MLKSLNYDNTEWCKINFLKANLLIHILR